MDLPNSRNEGFYYMELKRTAGGAAEHDGLIRQ
jgi:hypothetical protein